MKKRDFILIALITLFIIIVVISYYLLIKQELAKQKINQPSQAITSFIPDSNDTITIMSWNIQIFGIAKWNKTNIKEKMLDVISRADIIFIQEIRDKSGEAFRELCNQLNESFKCNISSRAGRSSSKEQYGIIYKKDINLTSITDYNPDGMDRWERPPIEVTFLFGNYEFRATNIHTKPENATIELKNLEMLYYTSSWAGNRVWLGDLNADCGYYDENNKTVFLNECWVIKDNDDTTATNSSCAYDRIIINKDMQEEYIRYGIYKNITIEISDHYPVWVEIKNQEVLP
jgi:endonuclease/exonuclease/phosphatase family metal-dependent hydrolase